MKKMLTKHGNSLALVIDKPILELLKFDATTPLEVSTDGERLIVSRSQDERRREKFEAALKDTFEKYDNMLKRLAE